MDTPPYLTDSHLHFDAFAEAGEVEGIVARAREAGVARMVAIGTTAEANRLALETAERFPRVVRAVVGYDRDQATENPSMEDLCALLDRPGVGGVGECGLDYHYTPESAAEQKALFQRQLDLAADRGLPVVVHSRDADDDTLSLLTAYAARWKGAPDGLGVLHCYTRGTELARALLDLGMMISFSGIVTFKNAAELREVAGIVPDDRLLIETDAPYLAPVPHRGKRNEPAFLPHIAACLAEVRDTSPEEIARITSANAARLFGWEEGTEPRT